MSQWATPLPNFGRGFCHSVGFGGQFVAGGRTFLCDGRKSLGHRLDLIHGLTNLSDSGHLLSRSGVDVADQGPDLARALGNAPNGLHDAAQAIVAFVCVAQRFVNSRRSFRCGSRTTLRQVANLVRNDGEAHAGLTLTCGLNRRIQRQNLGLKGDLVDDLEYPGNLPAGFGDLLHRLGRAIERGIGLHYLLIHHADEFHGFGGAVRVTLGDRCQLSGSGGNVFERG